MRKKAIKKTQTYFRVNESNGHAHAVHGNVSDNQDQYNESSSESNTPAHTEQSMNECRKAHLFVLYNTIKTRSKNPCLMKKTATVSEPSGSLFRHRIKVRN